MNLNAILAPETGMAQLNNVPKPSKLHAAAQQFEGLVIGEMLRAQREDGADGWLGSGGDSGDDSAMDMAEGQLSNALAVGGGLGLAKMIEKTMSHADTANRSTSAIPGA